MFRRNRGVETCHEGANVGVERIDGCSVKRHSDGADPLAGTIGGLFLGWGQCRSGAGAATAAGCREQVGGGMIIGVAHLNTHFGNGYRNRIAPFMVTVTINIDIYSNAERASVDARLCQIS